MLQQIFTSKSGDHSTAPSGAGIVGVLTPQDESTLKTDIDRMYCMSRRGLWGLLIFLVFSAMAYYFRNCTLSSILSGDVVAQLGPAPNVILVNIVFGASSVSSLLIIAGRIYNGFQPSNTWTHLDFRVFLYLLYFISGSLNEYFNVVFISGLVVLGLQHCNVWNYYTRAIEISLNKFESCERGVSEK
jgi:hypothetical protein